MRTLKLSAVFLAALALGAPFAFGTELDRDEYVAKVESICKANVQANEKILKGVREKVKEDKLKAASVQFAAASRALTKTLRQLEAVPKPADDKASLTRWLRYIKAETELLAKVAAKLKAEEKLAAQTLVVRLTRTANLANTQVLEFDFTYCRFDPSTV